jgi:arylformamidase
MRAMELYRGMDASTLEAKYNLRALRGDDFDEMVARWLERCAKLHERPGTRVDLAYGDGEREKLDLFSGGNPSGPLLIYIHGGYWQRGDKSMYSFICESFIRHGVSVAIMNYDLTPSVRIGQIPSQIRKCIAWLWDNAADLGFSREQLHVMGHSAGGHLTGMMMATDWPGYDSRLPADLIRSGIPLSGLFELEPLVHTTINGGPQMSVAEAIAESPLFLPLATSAPQLVVTGGGETSELRRQSDAYVEKFFGPNQPMERYNEPDVDHFDVLERLADETTGFFQKSMQLITR